MQEAFPELTLVKGFYRCHLTGQLYPHRWLETTSGHIVDPTASQFASGTFGEYIRIDDPEPTGKCCNCGGYCYDGSFLCCEKCVTEYASFCMGN
jgi:hypothetical protein